jgi:hypothetical protein
MDLIHSLRLLTNPARDAGFVFTWPVEFVSSLGQQMVNLLPIFLHCKGQPKNQNPGVAPPDCALLFCWPKRVSRKGLRCAGHILLPVSADFFQQ